MGVVGVGEKRRAGEESKGSEEGENRGGEEGRKGEAGGDGGWRWKRGEKRGAGETGIPDGRTQGYPPGWASRRTVTHPAPEAAAKGCVSGRCGWR